LKAFYWNLLVSLKDLEQGWVGVCREDGVALCDRVAELLLDRPGDYVAVPFVRVDHGDRESIQGG